MAELAISSYHRTLKNKDTKFAVGRAGNVGGGDWNETRIIILLC